MREERETWIRGDPREVDIVEAREWEAIREFRTIDPIDPELGWEHTGWWGCHKDSQLE